MGNLDLMAIFSNNAKTGIVASNPFKGVEFDETIIVSMTEVNKVRVSPNLLKRPLPACRPPKSSVD